MGSSLQSLLFIADARKGKEEVINILQAALKNSSCGLIPDLAEKNTSYMVVKIYNILNAKRESATQKFLANRNLDVEKPKQGFCAQAEKQKKKFRIAHLRTKIIKIAEERAEYPNKDFYDYLIKKTNYKVKSRTSINIELLIQII